MTAVLTRCDCCNRKYDSTNTAFTDWCPECVAHDPKLSGDGRLVAPEVTVEACPHYEYPDEDSWTLTGVR